MDANASNEPSLGQRPIFKTALPCFCFWLSTLNWRTATVGGDFHCKFTRDPSMMAIPLLRERLSWPLEVYNIQCNAIVSQNQIWQRAKQHCFQTSSDQKPITKTAPFIFICICVWIYICLFSLYQNSFLKEGFHCFCEDCKLIKDSDVTGPCQTPLLYDAYVCQTLFSPFQNISFSNH